MKKHLLLSALVALPVLFACNKSFDANYANQIKNQPVTIPTGANISQAGTYMTQGSPKKDKEGHQETYQGKDVMTRTVFSTNADNGCVSWKEDYIEATKATKVTIIRKYDFQTGTYALTTTVTDDKGAVTTIKLTLSDGQDVSIEISKDGDKDKVEIIVSHQDEGGNTVEDQRIEVEEITTPNNQDAVTINGTWTVKSTVVSTRSATLNRDGLDIHGVAEWANSLGLVEEKDVQETVGYKVTNVIITDSALSINFENGKSFASTLNIASLSSFTVEDFAGNDSDSVKKYFNGTGSFELNGSKCILAIQGELKGQNDNSVTPISVILTLVK